MINQQAPPATRFPRSVKQKYPIGIHKTLRATLAQILHYGQPGAGPQAQWLL